MADKLQVSDDPDGTDDLVFVKIKDGKFGGWKVELLLERLSSKLEEKLLLCNSCKGLLREACLYHGELRCRVCIPKGAPSWQPVKMNSEIVNEKMISCPLKRRGCEWEGTVTVALLHLEKCDFFPELCPLGCLSPEGDRKGKVIRLERRFIPEHQRDSCSLRKLDCEFCNRKVKACQMNPHLENCEDFPVPCPNECATKGEEGAKLMKRRHVAVHLADKCPLQKVQCIYWDHGCREKLERRKLDLHEREFMHIHYRISMVEMKKKQIETVKLFQRATERIKILENENISKTKELTEVKDNLKIANNKIDILDKQITEKDTELNSVKEILCSYTLLPSGQLKWKIDGVRKRIRTNDTIFSDPFYVGLYKCQGYIDWNFKNKGQVGIFIIFINGEYDDKLHWPVRYKYSFILLSQNYYTDLIHSSHITKQDLEKFPNSFKRPTGLRNNCFGNPSFISNTAIRERVPWEADNIHLEIKIELLPFL
ncbi:TNF receptor-associated factor 4-like [Oopsacas minuta]|uniref:TNF receptor-associated factor 4-like n=1 Tax=Oopsacas minuta TaxID=111878 RepID=A0AAV7JL33_9METZ|nr:TNF receptor-associated factor 4-like [Oopsacas minuta]